MPGGRLLPELGLEMWTNRCRLNLYGGFFSCIDTVAGIPAEHLILPIETRKP